MMDRRALLACLALVAPVLAACGSGTPPPGPPEEGLVARPLPDGRFEGKVLWEFDASGLVGGRSVESYLWRFGGLEVATGSGSLFRGYGREGVYDVGLRATLEDGSVVEATTSFTVDDLPYDYWGAPPEAVTVTADGEPLAMPLWSSWDVSADGRFVAFDTDAPALPGLDANGAYDVYVKDMETGELRLVSAAEDGSAAGGEGPVAMSGDGRYVAYVAGDAVAVTDLAAGGTVEVSVPDGLQHAEAVALSRDGSRLLLAAWTPGTQQESGYVVDLGTLTLTRLGALDGGGFARVRPVAMSADGGTVAFYTPHPFDAGDGNGLDDLYVVHLASGAPQLASTDAMGTVADRGAWAWGPVLSEDGRYVAFHGDATDLPRASENDHGGTRVDDVYVKDLLTGALELVSTNARGDAADSDSVLPTVSYDGRYVAFGSYATNLAPHADDPEACLLGLCANGFAYVKDRLTGRVAVVTVGLHDTLPDDWDQIEPRISGDGRYVTFYSSATNLGVDIGGDPRARHYYRAENPLWEQAP